MRAWLLTLLRGDDATAALCTIIIAMLRERPSDWKFDRHYAIHQSGVRIWMANKVYGLHIEHGRRYFPPTITPRWWWRRGIYRAARSQRATAIQQDMIEQYQGIRDDVVSSSRRVAR